MTTSLPFKMPVLRFQGEHRFLSNFWYVPEGVTISLGDTSLEGPTTEHVYQAAKTLDPEAQRTILSQATPHEAKRLGKHLDLRPDWDLVKLSVMAELQTAKYRNTNLASQLIDTGHAPIIEGNDWCDIFWGACTCPLHQGLGENRLGQILEIERSRLHSRVSS